MSLNFYKFGIYQTNLFPMKRIIFLLVSIYSVSVFAQINASSGTKEVTETVSDIYKRVYHVKENAQDSLHGEFSEVYNGIEITHGQYSNHKPDGKWIFKSLSGNALRIVSLKNGLFDGEYIQFFDSGDTMIYANYKEGKRDGIQKTFHSNHLVESIGFYKNGKADGIFTDYFKNGMLSKSCEYSDGKMNGDYTLYYDLAGKCEEGHYVLGKKEGVFKHYYPGGVVRDEIEYKNGLPWNLVRSQKSNGKHNKKSGSLVDGNGSYVLFDNNGKAIRKATEKNGLYEGIVYDYRGGKPVRQINYVHGLKSGESKYFYDNGSLMRKENFVNDTLEGHSVSYWNDGKMNREGDYHKGEKVKGTWYSINSQGVRTLQKDQENEEKKSEPARFPDAMMVSNSLIYSPSDEIYSFAEIMPSYPGGETEFFNYLKRTTKYPQMAKEMNKQGTVLVSFVVNRLGFIESAKVVKSVDPLLDKEAMRVIQSMPSWAPGYMNGGPVRVTIVQPIKFVLK